MLFRSNARSESDAQPEADTQSESDAQRATSETATEDTESAESDSETSSETEATSETASESEQASPASSDATDADGPDDSHIPWVLRRSSVKDDRPNITQFFLRDETDRAERRLRSDVEEILDKDVYTLDLREAAYLVARRTGAKLAEQSKDYSGRFPNIVIKNT